MPKTGEPMICRASRCLHLIRLGLFSLLFLPLASPGFSQDKVDADNEIPIFAVEFGEETAEDTFIPAGRFRLDPFDFAVLPRPGSGGWSQFGLASANSALWMLDGETWDRALLEQIAVDGFRDLSHQLRAEAASVGLEHLGVTGDLTRETCGGEALFECAQAYTLFDQWTREIYGLFVVAELSRPGRSEVMALRPHIQGPSQRDATRVRVSLFCDLNREDGSTLVEAQDCRLVSSAAIQIASDL